MNERITELIIEANNYATENHPILNDADSMTKELIVGNRFGVSQRKLAELIVRECCQKLENNGMVEVAMEMKEHFGVE